MKTVIIAQSHLRRIMSEQYYGVRHSKDIHQAGVVDNEHQLLRIKRFDVKVHHSYSP